MKTITNHGTPIEIEQPAKRKTQSGIEMIAAERERQITEEGWTAEHDDSHEDGELALAAAAYAIDAAGCIPAPECLLNGMGPRKDLWPFGLDWWKPGFDETRDLVKAGALIAAEIDRRQRRAILDSENAQAMASPPLTPQDTDHE